MADERSFKYQWDRIVWNVQALIAERRIRKAADALLAIGEPVLALVAIDILRDMPLDYKSKASMRDRGLARSHPSIKEEGE